VSDGEKKPRIRWAMVSETFGAAMPYGSCNAQVDNPDVGMTVCGWPRRKDGTCLAGHPAQPRPRRKRKAQ
jgi:hypothetical protein